ncbi:sensor histidine kinase [Rothia halotolerans]|uniref:sensor histidine kinase n=1 Tax=Rothia halotolerans TaxID=405770 RepID=UPI0013EC613F|nr:histidine kinase [Rothia halotolerans]
MTTSMWRKLSRPLYAVSEGPWLALFALAMQPFLAFAALMLLLAVVGGLGSYSLTSPLILLLPFICVAMIPLFGLWYGYIERGRLWVLGFDGVASGHVRLPLRPFWTWIRVRYREPATWREVLATVIGGIFGLVSAVILILETATAAALAASLVTLGLVREEIQSNYLGPLAPLAPDVAGFTPDEWWKFALLLLLALIVFGYLNGLLAAISASASKALLAPRPEEIQRQIEGLTNSRARIMESFEGERRRIERDLHDGVQQELVNLSLRLGMIELDIKGLEQQGVDAAGAREQLTLAQEQARHALQTLRNTVRGIYPAVLEDHGLRAALEELANNCILPVDLSYCATTVLPQNIERTAYYAANEGIANALKHSTASRLGITAHSAEGTLHLEISDNGQGGADPAHGSGIAGLNERAEAMGGTVVVDSPAGGPTTLRVRLPLNQDERVNTLRF